MGKIHIVAIILVIILTSSCKKGVKENSIPTDKCLLLKYSENTNCKVLYIFKKGVNTQDSICFETRNNLSEIDDYSSFHPKNRIFFHDGEYKPDSLSRILLWDFNKKIQIKGFPINYLAITIDSLQNDSILCFKINNKNHLLRPNCIFSDTIVSIEKESHRLIKHSRIIHLENLGMILKRNIYDNKTINSNILKIFRDEETPPYRVPDSMPVFPGGEQALQKYLQKHLCFHNNSIKEQDIIYVDLIIDSLGKISKTQVLRGFNDEYDKKVLKMVKNMPVWKPAIYNGANVSSIYCIPIYMNKYVH